MPVKLDGGGGTYAHIITTGTNEDIDIIPNGNGDVNFQEASLNIGADAEDGFTFRRDINSIQASRNGGQPMSLRRRASDGAIVGFRRDNTDVGNITVSTTATAYNTTSDYRLKDHIQPVGDALELLKALNVVRYEFKTEPGKMQIGFLAHEVQALLPQAVTGQKDAVEAIGNIVSDGIVITPGVRKSESEVIIKKIESEYQSLYSDDEIKDGKIRTVFEKTGDEIIAQQIDHSKLVPLLTAALQQAVDKIEDLKVRVAALEARP